MTQEFPAGRMQLAEHASKRQVGAMVRFQTSIELEEHLHQLLSLRASQINGCAFCIDMHWKDARAAGETEGATRSTPGVGARSTTRASGRRWSSARR